MSKSRKNKTGIKFITWVIVFIVALVGYNNRDFVNNSNDNKQVITSNHYEENADNYEITDKTEEISSNKILDFSIADVPKYSQSPYTVINNNVPYFSKEDLTAKSYEKYGELDNIGRCTIAIASVGKDLMPTEDRGNISSIKPTGWQIAKYDFVDGKYLYNRCHLIGFQLTGENANERNLITGTRYMNVQGMLPFENMIADYVKETGNHVLYRVTPIFEEDNLVASGVLMEAKSVEDDGEGIEFNVYCYNVQPGVEIDYATGNSAKANKEATEEEHNYILNTNSKKFHEPTCSGVNNITEKNKSEYTGTRETLILQGYTPCGNCNP